MNKCTVKEARLYEESGQYYISAKYRVETDHEVKEVVVPKIELPILKDVSKGISFRKEISEGWFGNPKCDVYIDVGRGELTLRKDSILGYPGSHYFIEKVIEEKKTEMTVEEIEEKLGYKIKIVGEKNG